MEWLFHFVNKSGGDIANLGGTRFYHNILWGAFAAIFMTLFGTVFAHIFFKKKPDSYYSWRDDAEKAEEESVNTNALENDKDLPGTLVSILPLVMPLLLIVGNTTCSMLFPADSTIVAITSFIGDANVALALGCLLAVILLGKRMGKDTVMKVIDKSLKEAGPIVFITAAGGALGEVLSVSGAGADLASMVINTGLPFILIPFVISAILKVVQGSGTVAVTTAATLCAPIAAALGLDPILIFLASGAGARACCHANDSFFWVFTNCMGYDMKGGLKTLSLANPFMALGGLFGTFLASLII